MIQSRKDLLHQIQQEKVLREIFKIVEESDHGDAAHDLDHLLRVAFWALRFSENKIPAWIVIAAALLHDIVNLPKNSPQQSKASELSAEKAGLILRENGFNPAESAFIQAAIRDHSFSRGKKPENFLGECLQDADRLEAIGTIGIMRTFYTGARLGASFFDGEDPWGKNRVLDDKKYSIDHFFTKLLHLQDTMNTPSGREEARRRTKVLETFLKDLADEIGVPCDF